MKLLDKEIPLLVFSGTKDPVSNMGKGAVKLYECLKDCNCKEYNELKKVIETDKNISKPPKSTTIVIGNMEIYIPLKDLIDINKEIDRLNVQIENLKGRLNAVNNKLNNKQFVDNAPDDIVNHEKNKKKRYDTELDILQNNLDSLI